MKNRGFTLAEMVAVIAIMALLALISAPFVKGYIDDAYNGKAIVHLREIYEARKNFEKDFPGTTISDGGGAGTLESCTSDKIYSGNTFIWNKYALVTCGYLRSTDLETRYEFKVGRGIASCAACDEGHTPIVSMTGKANAGLYRDKCACIDSWGREYRQSPDDGSGN